MCFTADCWYVPFITFMAYHRTFRESNRTSGTSGVGLCVVHFVHLHVFMILFPLSGVRSGIRVKPMISSYLFPFILQTFHVLFEIFIFINAYWCPTRFPHQMMFGRFNTDTLSATSGGRTGYTSRSSGFSHSFRVVHAAQSFDFRVILWGSLFFLLSHFVLAIAFSVLRFQTSKYPYEVLKLFI